MFVQAGGEKRLYISYDGNVVVQVDDASIATIYTRDYFDPGTLRIIEEAEKCRLRQ